MSANKAKPVLNQQQIRRLIPHQGAMCLLERVEYWDEKSIHCTSNSHKNPDNPLCLDGQLSALHLLEYGAQAMALHSGLLKQAVTPGFFAAARHIQLFVDTIHDIEDELSITAKLQMNSKDGAVYDIDIGTIQAQPLLSARITVINTGASA